MRTTLLLGGDTEVSGVPICPSDICPQVGETLAMTFGALQFLHLRPLATSASGGQY
ncbi:hypothetical protein [Fulvivirga imtechensis]|uniref:hypothetical protein n=1 Tax=Fulvivirga imtechensis TaxID=881893 RepID=UPI0012FAAD9B|nr:hypothetical protein [Fulvivirga imtechensis]